MLLLLVTGFFSGREMIVSDEMVRVWLGVDFGL